MLDPFLYFEDPTYLKVVSYLCFIWPKKLCFVSAYLQNCFRENLLINLSHKDTSFMTVAGVTTVAKEIYFVHLCVCRKPFIKKYDVLWVLELVEVCCS